MRRAYAAAVFLFLTCCVHNENGTISGHALLAGNGDSSGIRVTYVANDGSVEQTTTGADGSYSFTDLYQWAVSATITATADSTLEGTLSEQVVVPYDSHTDNTSVTSPTLSFTPVGAVDIDVTVAGAAQSGVLVALEGTSVTCVTDVAGRCALDRVPIGTYTISASAAGHTPTSLPGEVVAYKGPTTFAVAVP